MPPITLTGSKTATEKQIIGDENEIEEDVWLISSVKTVQEEESQQASYEAGKEDEGNSLTYRGIAILDVFEPYLSELKKDLVVGENKNGSVSNLFLEKNIKTSPEIKQKYDPSLKDDREKGRPYRMLIETVKQVNRARKMLMGGYILARKSKDKAFKANQKQLLAEQRVRYQGQTLPGQYIQTLQGAWTRK